MNIDLLVRENIRSLKPYHCARQDYLSGILLDANENSFGSVIQSESIVLHRYPDPFQQELRALLAKKNEVSEENIFVGVGSDEVIDLIIRIFCEPKTDSVLLIEPTYGMYRVSASIQNAQVRSCLLTEDFQIDLQEVWKSIDKTTKLIFCCSPNNPTANLLRDEDILEMCDFGPIVVVDEAYIDFSRKKSLGNKVLYFPNLIIMRTLSKAWGLAGIRLGYAIADANVISYLLKVKAPYNVNILTSKMALEALQMDNEVEKKVESIIQQRTCLIDALKRLQCVEHVYPSDTNFILVRCKDANELYRYLAERNIIVRNRSNEPRLKNCLRITVGTPDENKLLIETIKEYCK